MHPLCLKPYNRHETSPLINSLRTKLLNVLKTRSALITTVLSDGIPSEPSFGVIACLCWIVDK